MMSNIFPVKESLFIVRIILVSLFLFIGTASCKNPNPSFSNSEKPLFEILYYANLNGNIENCNCGEPPLGGLDRISTVIKRYREKNPELIVIDGGDTFNTYSFPELNTAIVKAYQVIKPDIWLLSEQELIEGDLFLADAVRKVEAEIISTNYSFKNIQSKKTKKYSLHKKNVHIYGFLQPGLFRIHSDKTKIEQAQFKQFLRVLKKEEYNILIFHGETDLLENNSDQFQDFDLILTAHMQNDNRNTESKPAIIGAGTDGENIIHISLHKSGNGIIITVEQIAIGLDIESDQKIQQFIQDYKNNQDN